MMDRSVISKRDPDSEPMSNEQITTFKMKCVTSTKPAPISYKLRTMGRAIMSMCTFSKKKSQCQMYGHILPKKHGFNVDIALKCTDCGTKITSPDQLRTPVARVGAPNLVSDGSWK